MRILANVILIVAVLAGQGASNLNLCLACAHVDFDLCGDHDCHDGHEDHGFAEADSQCGYCTQTDFAVIHCDVAQFNALPLTTPQLAEIGAFAIVEFSPLVTESPPRPLAPSGTFFLRV